MSKFSVPGGQGLVADVALVGLLAGVSAEVVLQAAALHRGGNF